MYDGMKLYRAVVAASSPSTGAVYVSIPSVLGPTTTIGVSTIGRGPVGGVWAVPSVGDQVVVAVEDDKFSNLYLAYPAPQQTLTISDGSITTNKLANGSVTESKLGFAVPGMGPPILKLSRVSPQSIPGLTATLVSFDTENSDSSGLITVPSTTVTIPNGMSGLYAVSIKVTRVSGTSFIGVSFRVNNAQNMFEVAPPSATVLTGGILYLEGNDTGQLRIESNSTVSVTATLWMTRILS